MARAKAEADASGPFSIFTKEGEKNKDNSPRRLAVQLANANVIEDLGNGTYAVFFGNQRFHIVAPEGSKLEDLLDVGEAD